MIIHINIQNKSIYLVLKHNCLLILYTYSLKFVIFLFFFVLKNHFQNIISFLKYEERMKHQKINPLNIIQKSKQINDNR
jgi:flagellar biosynthesis protein FlhB